MSELVSQRHSVGILRVSIIASDLARFEILRTTVLARGHRIVEVVEAEVVLSDGAAVLTGKPTLTLGAPDRGQAGSLPVDASMEQIDAALRAVAAGLIVRAAPDPVAVGFEELPERTADALLTPREIDVLNAISAGLSNKAIARQLGISLHTVKFHIESLLRKLGARTRAEAVAKGLERRVRETVDL